MSLINQVTSFQASRSNIGFQVPQSALVAPEDILIRHTVGHATFTDDLKGVSLRGHIYQAGNLPDGTWEAYYNLTTPLTRADRKRKSSPPPFNIPIGPVPQPDPDAFGKAAWTFGDGSILYGLGQALVVSGTFQNNYGALWISSNLLLTQGATGRFHQCQGTNTGAISLLVPKFTKLKDLAGKTVDCKSIEVYRVTLGEWIAPAPAGPLPGTA